MLMLECSCSSARARVLVLECSRARACSTSFLRRTTHTSQVYIFMAFLLFVPSAAAVEKLGRASSFP